MRSAPKRMAWDRRIHTHSASPLSHNSCKSTSVLFVPALKPVTLRSCTGNMKDFLHRLQGVCLWCQTEGTWSRRGAPNVTSTHGQGTSHTIPLGRQRVVFAFSTTSGICFAAIACAIQRWEPGKDQIEVLDQCGLKCLENS